MRWCGWPSKCSTKRRWWKGPRFRRSAKYWLSRSYVPENRIRQGLVIGQSIGSNIILAIADRLLGRFRLISSIKRNRVIHGWIRKLGIKVQDPELPVETLSGGNQQRVVIARWLATSPKVLILDCPTVGIDVAAKRSVHQLIRELSQTGVGIILITDETGEVLNNCERVLLMRSGRFIACLNPKFLALQNILDLLKSYSLFGILSVGALVVLLSGGIDISFTAIA